MCEGCERRNPKKSERINHLELKYQGTIISTRDVMEGEEESHRINERAIVMGGLNLLRDRGLCAEVKIWVVEDIVVPLVLWFMDAGR